MKLVIKLTQKQEEFFNILADYIRREKIPPTNREILKMMGLKSPRSIAQYLDALEQGEYIKRGKGARNIKILKSPYDNNSAGKTVKVPVLGYVPCGTPFLAEENIETQISVSEKIAKPPYKYFILRAVGDSMNKAGINEGDLVLVRQQLTANNGDIVVALIDDEATIKKLRLHEEHITLEPNSTNPKHYPIVLERNFEIQGIVVRSMSEL
ncbi:MAG: transcriptional repressor LexA [Candidatus Omnitrophica bacterium]|nr:transcriptional repressor LexA [Candidatus Omnitrophota bacterium]